MFLLIEKFASDKKIMVSILFSDLIHLINYLYTKSKHFFPSLSVLIFFEPNRTHFLNVHVGSIRYNFL